MKILTIALSPSDMRPLSQASIEFETHVLGQCHIRQELSQERERLP